ncbi:hypothetical protein PHMEG_0001484 [Phytophthora megakarya]|uniref:Reverse transcriptase n=1 Tax=Phytophthora megakarya TaxID=4795 RepID=A0A225X1S8_9STRA|nr:hypothetical protein PHMEG_0001484 [Phytophthora megakarya]
MNSTPRNQQDSPNYADSRNVEKHVKSCPDCSLSKIKPQLRGYSPGNILAERPFQIVSMDFVIPQPKSRRGNTALLLFQCAFTGFVFAKPISDTTEFKVAHVFEECIYRRFGAPSLIRNDRDPRFMSEVFQAFAEMIQSRSRATLSYQPQANGQQERSVKTVMQSVKVYVEDLLQQDWDEIADHLIFAINNLIYTTRKETPFFLVHGWDTSSTMKATTTSLRHGTPKQSEALAWRREVNRQQELAWQMAQEYQHTEKSRRARLHNNALSKMEKTSLQNEEAEDLTLQDGEGSATKLKTSKKRCSKKEGERGSTWRESNQDSQRRSLIGDEFVFELELQDKSGYHFYPVVHISMLKPVNEFSSRPTTLLAPEIAEDSRMDFDEALLPEDSWEPDHLAGEYEVEAILDDRRPLQTGTEKSLREFKVKWVGYNEPTWEPASHLSCDGLLYDYLQRKKSEHRFQMVQVADEN